MKRSIRFNKEREREMRVPEMPTKREREDCVLSVKEKMRID
jgi:hypothetical protein